MEPNVKRFLENVRHRKKQSDALGLLEIGVRNQKFANKFWRVILVNDLLIILNVFIWITSIIYLVNL
jgi:hypothetical protein